MADLKDFVPRTSQTVEAIFSAYKADGDAEPSRGYLGASIIGAECERSLWYAFRGCSKEDIPGRIYRLFENGDLEEIRMVKDLRRIGCTVHDVDPNTGEQFEIKELGGHFSGHMDGCCLGLPEAPKTWHVLEFKTHNAKSFKKLEKEGVKKSKPMHYGQTQAYMLGTRMKRALYLAVNKDTDELYSERIKEDKTYQENLMQVAERIIFSNTLPDRITKRPDFYKCKFCDSKSICWGTEALPVPSLSCRHCCFATPIRDGEHAQWKCDKHDKVLSGDCRDNPCGDLLLLPGMLDGHSEPVGHGVDEESGKDYITFQIKEPDSDGRTEWRHGAGGFSAAQLLPLSLAALSSPIVERAANLFDAEIERCTKGTVLARYVDDTSFVVWSGQARGLQAGWTSVYGSVLSGLTPLDEDEDLNQIACEYAAVNSAGAEVQVAVIVNVESHQAWILEGKQ